MLRLRAFFFSLGEYLANVLLLSLLAWPVWGALSILLGGPRVGYMACVVVCLSLGIANYAASLFVNYVVFANETVKIERLKELIKEVAIEKKEG